MKIIKSIFILIIILLCILIFRYYSFHNKIQKMSKPEYSVFLFNKDSINKLELINNENIKIEITNNDDIKNILYCFDDTVTVYPKDTIINGCYKTHWKNSTRINLYTSNKNFKFYFNGCDTSYQIIPLESIMCNSNNTDNLKYIKYGTFFTFIVKYNSEKLNETLKIYNIDMGYSR